MVLLKTDSSNDALSSVYSFKVHVPAKSCVQC